MSMRLPPGALFCLFAFVLSADAACTPVAGERILGRDLAIADSRFSALPASLAIGFAPTPGTKRVFSGAELSRIARANGISLADPGEICFEVPMRPVIAEDAKRAMVRSLGAESELNIVELQKIDIPDGDIQFPLAGLEPPVPQGNGVQLWRGFVRYGSARRMPLWARVLVQRNYVAVVAAVDLKPNILVKASDLRLESRKGALETRNSERNAIASRIEDVAGRIVKRPVRAGDPVPIVVVDLPIAIHRGQAVKVEVRSGSARLMFDAVAERDAREGDSISLRNPASGRTFEAKLEGLRAVIVVGGGQSL